MVELKNGGYMMGGEDAVMLLESVLQMIPCENQAKEFPMLYERAVERLRWYVIQHTPKPLKITKTKYKTYGDHLYNCGACGFGIHERDLPITKFCPNCGREILRNNLIGGVPKTAEPTQSGGLVNLADFLGGD